MEWVKIFAPATIGNIGPGFDVLGLAVLGLGDIIEARKIPSGISIGEIKSEAPLSGDPDKNTAGIAAREVLKRISADGGIELKIKKGLPCGSGLGSSAASAAAAAFAANLLYGEPLSKEELILPATLAEEAVSGAFFADNTAPALLGGATLTRSIKPLEVFRIGTISELRIILVTPNLTVLTKDARAVLPSEVPLKKFIANMAHACLVAAAFAKNDYRLMAKGLQDVVIEPARAGLIRGFDSVKQAALEAGADGMAISGSGPTIFAISDSDEKGAGILKAMLAAFEKSGVSATGIVTRVDSEGARSLTP